MKSVTKWKRKRNFISFPNQKKNSKRIFFLYFISFSQNIEYQKKISFLVLLLNFKSQRDLNLLFFFLNTKTKTIPFFFFLNVNILDFCIYNKKLKTEKKNQEFPSLSLSLSLAFFK